MTSFKSAAAVAAFAVAALAGTGLASAQGVIVVIGTIIVATFALRTVSSLFEEGN